MKIIGLDGGATKVSGGIVEQVNESTFRIIDPTIDIQYSDHPNFNPDFSSLPLDQQTDVEISKAECRQGKVFIDCACEVIKSLTGNDPFHVAIAMPGIKTENGRGIASMANGPRIPDFCDQLEEAISLVLPIQRLESDADMCAWGEEYGEEGAFRSVNNAYYLGGGTGTADGLKLNGTLLPFDEASNWIGKSIKLKMINGKSLETYTSMSGIHALREFITDDEIGSALGQLIFERISTIYSGWGGLFIIDQNLKSEHPYLGTLLDRIVIGQRLSQFLQSEEGKPTYKAVMKTLTNQCADAHSAISDHFLVNGEFDSSRIILSDLRAAPIIGLGAKVWVSQC